MTHLWKNFAVALLVTLLVIGGLAWFVSRMLVTPPPKRIMTSAFQMDLAEGWSCYQEGTTWTCEPGEPGEQKAVVAVFAMKYRGPEDTPKAYAEYLRTPKSLTTRDGGTQLSTVKYVKVSRIGGYDWTDALHLGSEIGGYYTHYLAAVTSHLSILVSFTAYEDDFDKYNPELEQMIGSLLVYQRPLDASSPESGPSRTGEGTAR
jgi:hypothetical protein